jgi:hypothetical protein
MKKDTKKTVKKTKKEFKPAFIADLTEAKSARDAYVAFGLAKQGAGLPMTDAEFDAIINTTVEVCANACVDSLCACSKEIKVNADDKVVISKNGVEVKKPNVFRRFWNWLKRPFTR